MGADALVPVMTEHYTAGPSKRSAKPRGEAIGMETAKRTYHPAPAPRFAPEPGFRGPFELAGVGRDVETGKGWDEA